VIGRLGWCLPTSYAFRTLQEWSEGLPGVMGLAVVLNYACGTLLGLGFCLGLGYHLGYRRTLPGLYVAVTLGLLAWPGFASAIELYVRPIVPLVWLLAFNGLQWMYRWVQRSRWGQDSASLPQRVVKTVLLTWCVLWVIQMSLRLAGDIYQDRAWRGALAEARRQADEAYQERVLAFTVLRNVSRPGDRLGVVMLRSDPPVLVDCETFLRTGRRTAVVRADGPTPLHAQLLGLDYVLNLEYEGRRNALSPLPNLRLLYRTHPARGYVVPSHQYMGSLVHNILEHALPARWSVYAVAGAR